MTKEVINYKEREKYDWIKVSFDTIIKILILEGIGYKWITKWEREREREREISYTWIAAITSQTFAVLLCLLLQVSIFVIYSFN